MNFFIIDLKILSSIIVVNQVGECQFKEYKNIKELNINKEYKVERFQKVKIILPFSYIFCPRRI